MYINAYTIYDSKSEIYTQPFFQATDAVAQRAFQDLINDPEHPFGRHPQDYTLFALGTFDDSNAEILSQAPKSLGNGAEFKYQEDENQ